VELTLDYNELQNLSFASGADMPALLAQFKAAGITGIAISEETIGDLVGAGEAKYLRLRSDSGTETSLIVPNHDLAERVLRALNVSVSDNLPKITGADPMPFAVRAAPQALNGVGIGLSSAAVGMVHGAGLDVIARLQNSPAVSVKSIDTSIAELGDQKIDKVIFAGQEVLGFRGLIKYAAEKMKANHISYGSIEFGKQNGDETMSEALKSDFIRVHSISSAEMATMTPNAMSERFSRAAKERSIRLCYLHLPELVGEQPAKKSLGFVSEVRGDVEKGGYLMGKAHSFDQIDKKRVLLLMIALSIASGLVLLMSSLVTLTRGVKIGSLLTSFVLFAGLTVAHDKGLQLLALMAALIFPTLGAVALLGRYFSGANVEKSSVIKMVGLFIGTSVFSLSGALLVVGLLADRSYIMKVNQFLGIKAAHGVPMLIIILIMAAGLPIFKKSFAQVRSDVTANIRRIVAHPLFVWHVFAVVLALAIIGFALLRTGNEPGIGVSGLEMKFRTILDKVMMVRPRTKEFLIGHPALFLGIGFLLKRRREWGLCLVALGMLGQVSLLNTFCHIHTPLSMSLMRAANGLVLGLIIGYILWRIFGRSGQKTATRA